MRNPKHRRLREIKTEREMRSSRKRKKRVKKKKEKKKKKKAEIHFWSLYLGVVFNLVLVI